eukprot:713615-Prorocentrum_minimum.AAC.1
MCVCVCLYNGTEKYQEWSNAALAKAPASCAIFYTAGCGCHTNLDSQHLTAALTAALTAPHGR